MYFRRHDAEFAFNKDLVYKEFDYLQWRERRNKELNEIEPGKMSSWRLAGSRPGCTVLCNMAGQHYVGSERVRPLAALVRALNVN